MERYNSEYSTELINKMNTVLEGEERYILLEYLEKTGAEKYLSKEDLR